MPIEWIPLDRARVLLSPPHRPWLDGGRTVEDRLETILRTEGVSIRGRPDLTSAARLIGDQLKAADRIEFVGNGVWLTTGQDRTTFCDVEVDAAGFVVPEEVANHFGASVTRAGPKVNSNAPSRQRRGPRAPKGPILKAAYDFLFPNGHGDCTDAQAHGRTLDQLKKEGVEVIAAGAKTKGTPARGFGLDSFRRAIGKKT